MLARQLGPKRVAPPLLVFFFGVLLIDRWIYGVTKTKTDHVNE